MKINNNTHKNDIVTIVTVTYNAEKVLEETILSVINQTYDNIEYIIIDGASTDRTIDMIKKHEDKVDYWFSEPDDGIYSAMNKAIKKATGEWIIFMNAGDKFNSDHDLTKVFSEHDVSKYDFIYGEYYWSNGQTKRLIKNRPLESMWQRICFSHQSLFSRTNLMKEKPFNLSYKIVCDYENYFSRHMEGYRFLKVDFPIAVFLAGGVSDQNFFKRTFERYRVVLKYKNDIEMNKYYIKLLADHYLKPYFQKISNLKKSIIS